MEFIDEALLRYCEAHSSPESELLSKLNRDTHLKIPQARMLSGHLQGRYLAMISKILRPAYVLEIGTYTGYSALCLAEGLLPEGKLISIDSNEETLKFASGYINQSPFAKQIELVCADALSFIPGLNQIFDLAFIDADKQNYANYFDLVLPKLRSGGVILADNVLWSGKVLDQAMDKDTAALHAFNETYRKDDRVESLVLPIRDGISMFRKK